MKIYLLILTFCLSFVLEPSMAWKKQWDAPQIDDECLTYDARYSEVPLFEVRSTQKPVHFYTKKIAKTASVAQQQAARQKTYLVNGNVVFGGPEDKGYRCVYYGTASGNIVAGFVQTKHLMPYSEKQSLSQKFLVGTWTYAGNPKIKITAESSGKVKAVGHAFYDAGQGLYTGDFSAVAAFQGREMLFQDGPCQVRLLRRGPYLISVDNQNCGGRNVSFSSILVKVK